MAPPARLEQPKSDHRPTHLLIGSDTNPLHNRGIGCLGGSACGRAVSAGFGIHTIHVWDMDEPLVVQHDDPSVVCEVPSISLRGSCGKKQKKRRAADMEPASPPPPPLPTRKPWFSVHLPMPPPVPGGAHSDEFEDFEALDEAAQWALMGAVTSVAAVGVSHDFATAVSVCLQTYTVTSGAKSKSRVRVLWNASDTHDTEDVDVGRWTVGKHSESGAVVSDVTCCALTAGTSKVVVGTKSGAVYVFKTNGAGVPFATLKENGPPVISVCVSGSLVVVGFDNPEGMRELRCTVFDMVTGGELWRRVSPIQIRAAYASPTMLKSRYNVTQQPKKKKGSGRRIGEIKAV
jgi:hypothetical protein